MCRIIGEYTEETKVIGFKVVIKRDNKYYSPATGIEYKVGKVSQEFDEETSKGYNYDEIVNPVGSFYDEGMVGKTGVFIQEADAIMLQATLNKDLTILQMTIEGDLYEAKAPTKDWGNHEGAVIVGTTILSIEEIKK